MYTDVSANSFAYLVVAVAKLVSVSKFHLLASVSQNDNNKSAFYTEHMHVQGASCTCTLTLCNCYMHEAQ